ncbi:MAG: protein translocase subunit SecD, partial [Candidatus Puniceispirillum sp.]|nr:protein translocase subunit SecD [Candidatus Puniceispirillum sp.]
MLQFEGWKKLLVLFVILLGVIFALPNLSSNQDDMLADGSDGSVFGFLPGKHINLGLDLQGGSHLLLRVDMDVVEQERLDSIGETIRQEFRNEKIRFAGLKVDGKAVKVTIRNAEDASKAKTTFNDLGNGLTINSDALDYAISFSEGGLTELQSNTIAQSIEIIR